MFYVLILVGSCVTGDSYWSTIKVSWNIGHTG